MINSFQLIHKPVVKKPALSPHQTVNRVLWKVLFVNLLVAAIKILVGFFSGSISMIADGFHSAMDGSSNIIGLIGSTVAGRPPDSNHPYGHQKYETFATLCIGLILLLTSWNVLQSIVTRLIEGGTPEVSAFSFGVMIVTIILNLAVVVYESKRGRQLNSTILLADAAHTKSDVFVSLSVIASLIAVKLGWVWIDTVVALIIVLVIGHTGWKIVRRASDVLADCSVIDAAEVEKVVLSVDGIHSCHKIRSRGTEQQAHLDLHIQVDGQMTLNEAHELGHSVQDQLQQQLDIEDVMVHVEPTAK